MSSKEGKNQAKGSYKEIFTEKLFIGKSQMRTRDADAGIGELAESIKKVGLLEPIVVFETAEGFEIVTGQRRYLACLHLGWSKIPCMVLANKPDEKHALTISLTENLMRRDPSERDYIDACTQLFNTYGTIKAVVEETGLPQEKVSRYVKAPQLTEKLRNMVDDGKLSLAQALVANETANLPGGKNEDLANKVAHAFSDERMSLGKAKQIGRRIKAAIQRNGIEKFSEEDFERALSPIEVETRVPISLSGIVLDGLKSYALDLGTSTQGAGAELITQGLDSKGYLGRGDV